MEWRFDIKELENLESTYQRIFDKKAKLDAKRPLPYGVLHRLKEDLALEWTYNSNSIEGNTLTLQETKIVIEEGMTVKGKSLREHFETTNHHEAIEFLQTLVGNNYTLNEKDILDVHHIVMTKIEKEFAGRYRNGGVRIVGANFVPPNALKVDGLMNNLVTWVNKNSLQLNPLALATVFHHRFAMIHPFFDGNGRTIRLTMNLLLMKAGFPPAIILKNDRKKYYAALNQANNGNYQKLLLLIAQAAERTIDIYLSALPSTDLDDDYQSISTIVSEPDVPYGQEYVSLLARQGKIDAYKEGRNWVTTKNAIKYYIENRERERKLE
ncbi:MAG: Fic family protein [Chitinophagales bacterium]